jgi:hypothetical protein
MNMSRNKGNHMKFDILYNEAQGAVKTVELEASCLLEAEAKFKEAHPEATYWEFGIWGGFEFPGER